MGRWLRLITEIWKDIKGYEGDYQVSNLGRVRSLDRVQDIPNRWGGVTHRCKKGVMLKPCFDGKKNYLHITLKNHSRDIHRLVAETFIPNPNNYTEVNHKNEDKTDNRVNNLEWCTHKYNNNYGSKPMSARGSNNPQSKVTEDIVLEIKNKCDYMRTTDIANEYDLSPTHISAIKYGRKWGWLK